MQLLTQLKLKPEKSQVGYNSKILLLGSCFSENISAKFEYFKFQTKTNPFGILFHPLAIERFITYVVNQKKFTEETIFFHNGQWHCFNAHSKLSHTSKETLLENLNVQIEETHAFLKKATHIIITLGSSWAYRFAETNTMVANCHKVPQHQFIKELLPIENIFNALENIVESILNLNTKAQFIFTVSPVRHLKDGFIENTLSKAHLITAIHHLLSLPSQRRSLSYFPSYEIVMDELRDYRFYEADMIHPNSTAIDCIWEKFKTVWVNDSAKTTMDKVDALQKRLLHKPFNINSEAHHQFLKTTHKDIEALIQQFPFMSFD